MARHYILDGYNVIKSVDALADCSLENGREKLIEMVKKEKLQGSARNQVTIVFDGRDDVWGSPPRSESVRIFFTNGETADDFIKKMVEDEPNAKNIIVVTNDKELASYVQRLQARVIGVDGFLYSPALKGKILRSKGLRERQQKAVKNISYQNQQKINKELENLWLKRQ